MALTLNQLEDLLRGGHFTSVTFVKRTNGQIRRMVCRTGVRKGLKGVGPPYNFADKGLIPVWDAQKKHFRSIPAENVLSVKSGRREYVASEERQLGN